MDKEMQFLLYATPNEDINVDAIIRDKTIWLTQKSMADLFGIDKSELQYPLNVVQLMGKSKTLLQITIISIG